MTAKDEVQRGLEQWQRLTDECNRLQHELNGVRQQYDAAQQSWERQYAILQAENQLLRDRASRLENDLGYYMRHSSGLTTRLADISHMIGHAMKEARAFADRPELGNGQSIPAPGQLEALAQQIEQLPAEFRLDPPKSP